MKIKRFYGKNPLEVITRVKEELGEEALILSSRRHNGEGVYEIVAAIDGSSAEGFPAGRPEETPAELDLRRELQEIKTLLKEVLSPYKAGERFLRLVELGIPPEVAQKVVEDPLSWLKAHLKRSAATPFSRRNIFVGPAGAGKTSSIFKIAAWFRYHRGEAVRVLSLDRHRVGALQEARRLGDLLEIPVDTEVPDPLSEETYLLVDTPGWGGRFGPEDLREILEKIPRARVQLVLKATEHPLVWKHFLEQCMDFPVEGVVLTHADRIYCGLSLGFLLEENLPGISFVSLGPRIPEDLARATEEVLEKTFLRGLNLVYGLQ
ncbi:hypothetical protein [Thermosulfurimonas sp.]|uniref:flagellar biosynthesis protein FlhF n=1 Tax=Thermosulfurimonas sp. TaxID=2080236 RepID=UPI0025F507B6|nr:hypothetical protein [Thermosulfurimonas sp.]